MEDEASYINKTDGKDEIHGSQNAETVMYRYLEDMQLWYGLALIDCFNCNSCYVGMLVELSPHA